MRSADFSSSTKIVESVWFERYVNTRKGCCKWCSGSGQNWVTLGLDTEKREKPHWRTCPRCKGTGDEPDFGPWCSKIRSHNALEALGRLRRALAAPLLDRPSPLDAVLRDEEPEGGQRPRVQVEGFEGLRALDAQMPLDEGRRQSLGQVRSALFGGHHAGSLPPDGEGCKRDLDSRRGRRTDASTLPAGRSQLPRRCGKGFPYPSRGLG